LLGIINDILDLSKIESGRLELEHAPFSPDELLRGVLSLFDERARQKGLELSGHVDLAVPMRLGGDSTRLGQVLTNLVNNALKFTETGGVTVDWRLLDVSTPDRCRMRVEVSDSGIGVPPDKIATIFEQFSQADQSITRRFGGTGLGLSICKRLIEKMGGSIGADSEPGKGSRFWFELELEATEAAEPVATADSARRVVLAIANQRLRKHLARAFDERGFAVETLGAGEAVDETTLCVIGDETQILDSDDFPVPLVGVARMGDPWPEDALASGRVVDLLTLPATRPELSQLCARMIAGRFAGMDASPARPSSGAYLPDLAGANVLGVDDNPVNREILRDALNAMNARIRLAESGEQALAAAGESRFDIILMDISMPGMDGYEATRLIRTGERARGLPATPIVALSGNVAGSDAQRWRDAGMNAYLTKPFTIASLAKAVADQVPGVARQLAETQEIDNATGHDWIGAQTLAMLETLSSQTGADMAERIFSMFIEHAEPAMQTLLADLAAGETRAASRSAHAFKSMCHSAGATRLAAMLQGIESSAKSDRLQEAHRAAQQVGSALAHTVTAMRQRMHSGKPAGTAAETA
jgi:CheY-like chemotaxis protein